MESEELGVKELRERLADVLNGVAVRQHVVYVTSRGRRIAALVPLDMAENPTPQPAAKPRAEMPADLWERFGKVAKPDRSAVLTAFVGWFCRERGAKLPRRPD